jgi:hypothetical protein
MAIAYYVSITNNTVLPVDIELVFGPSDTSAAQWFRNQIAVGESFAQLVMLRVNAYSANDKAYIKVCKTVETTPVDATFSTVSSGSGSVHVSLQPLFVFQ